MAPRTDLLALPAELRLTIYRFLFCTGEIKNHALDDVRPELSAQLLRTCRQVASEGLPILYGENKFCVAYHGIGQALPKLTKFVETSGATAKYIKNIRLCETGSFSGSHDLDLTPVALDTIGKLESLAKIDIAGAIEPVLTSADHDFAKDPTSQDSRSVQLPVQVIDSLFRLFPELKMRMLTKVIPRMAGDNDTDSESYFHSVWYFAAALAGEGFPGLGFVVHEVKRGEVIETGGDEGQGNYELVYGGKYAL
ncbi:hypothetical protein EJ08DRAFT_702255 [Tothia fuscella]|uniref:Uncharacterized protein n=1 Tax=Tothia fuscella TaxID=1048955 RepID=A0A9P4TTB9_9PEZI|nr:hypothetical protein EJ08DRAFT_702255 [Tothia fuscella]